MIGKITIERAGGYDPAKGKTHPNNRDPGLEKCAYAAFDKTGEWVAVAPEDGDLDFIETAFVQWLRHGLKIHRVSLDWVKAHSLLTVCEPPPHAPLLSLTPRQTDLLDFIGKFWIEKRHGPSIKEMAEYLGVASHATVHGLLQRLHNAGAIRRKAGKPRSVQIVEGYRADEHDDRNPV